MLHPQVIANRRFGSKSTQAIQLIQYRNSPADDNNNSNKVNSSKQTERRVKRKRSFGCCVAQHSFENIPEETHPAKSEQKVEPETEQEIKKQETGWADVRKALVNKKHILEKLSPRSKKSSAKVSLVEYYTDEIAGEIVIINKHHLFNTDDSEEVTIVVRDYLTPLNFCKTIEYYRQINRARETFLRAAQVAGTCLLRGECDGNRADWADYLYRAGVAKREWRKNCQKNTLLHERKKLPKVITPGLFDYCIKLRKEIWRRCIKQLKDIFPCCFPP